MSDRHEAPGRRRVVRAALTGAVAVAAGLGSGARGTPSAVRAAGAAALRPTSPEAALGALVAGNARWRTYHERHPDQTRTVRRTLVGGQHPFAVVLGCVDSRVPRSSSSTRGSATC